MGSIWKTGRLTAERRSVKYLTPATAFEQLSGGRDCFDRISLRDPPTIARLVKALAAPININVRAGSPSVAELEALGVARASTASALALMAASTIRQIAEELKASGRFDALNPTMTQADAQRLFAES